MWLVALVGCGTAPAEKPVEASPREVDARIGDAPPVVVADAASGAQGTWQFFPVDVPSWTTVATVTSAGGSGDVDLYVAELEPTLTAFDCRSWNPGNAEVCNMDPPRSAYVVGLYGYTDYSGVVVSMLLGGQPDETDDSGLFDSGFEASLHDSGILDDSGRINPEWWEEVTEDSGLTQALDSGLLDSFSVDSGTFDSGWVQDFEDSGILDSDQAAWWDNLLDSGTFDSGQP